MGTDDDIAAQLPEPPPPAPAPRQAAIDQALRRFDAVHHGKPFDQPTIARPARAPWFAAIGRPQAAALVTAGLIALFGVPAAWLSVSHRPTPAQQERLASADRIAPPPLLRLDRVAQPPASDSAPGMMAAPTVVASPVIAPAPVAPAPQGEPRQEMARLGADEAPMASASAAAPADALLPAEAEGRMTRAKQSFREASRDRVELADAAPPPAKSVTMLAPPAPPPAPAVVAVRENYAAGLQATAQRRADSESDKDIVTTGRRGSEALANKPVSVAGAASKSRKESRRGDWNACTINDPDHSPGKCKALIDPAAAGAKGRAAARVADGLARAWQGDLDGAIAAFGQAIATNPRDAAAYLNRGLALQRKGDFSRANLDLDRAVRYAPGAARAYYNRSQLLRQRGEADRATADAQRAVALDPSYDGVAQ